MELRSGLRLLREQWKLILAMVVLAVAASGYLTWRETPVYASEVTMYVSAWGSPDDTTSAYQGSLLSQQKVKSYTELMRGHRVMTGVIAELGLETTPDRLAEQVSSSAIPDTSLLTVTARDPSPRRAQQLADAVGAEFVALVPALESVSVEDQPAVRVTVVSPADLPAAPVSPRPVRNLALAFAVGLLAGFGLAVARRSLDNTVKTAEQVEELSKVPVLGSVPVDAAAAKQPLLVAAAHGPRVESFRKIHTNLQFVDVDKNHRTLVVTSAMPDEGKSVTAGNLAFVLAETSKHVIVVDGDLRRSSVSRYFGLPNGVGLTSVLLGQVGLEQATQPWGPNVDVLTSGPVPPNPTTLLGSQQMQQLLRELAARYDAVIVDSPPVLPIADTAVLAAACDGAVIVVRHGKTRQDQLREAAGALRAANVPLLGMVLNGVPLSRKGSYRYDYAAPEPPPSTESESRPRRPAPATR